MFHRSSESSSMVEVKCKHHHDPLLMELKESVHSNFKKAFSQAGRHGLLWYQVRLSVPNVDDLRRKIFEEAHGSRYSIHTGATKIYCDLQWFISGIG